MFDDLDGRTSKRVTRVCQTIVDFAAARDDGSARNERDYFKASINLQSDQVFTGRMPFLSTEWIYFGRQKMYNTRTEQIWHMLMYVAS